MISNKLSYVVFHFHSNNVVQTKLHDTNKYNSWLGRETQQRKFQTAQAGHAAFGTKDNWQNRERNMAGKQTTTILLRNDRNRGAKRTPGNTRKDNLKPERIQQKPIELQRQRHQRQRQRKNNQSQTQSEHLGQRIQQNNTLQSKNKNNSENQVTIRNDTIKRSNNRIVSPSPPIKATIQNGSYRNYKNQTQSKQGNLQNINRPKIQVANRIPTAEQNDRASTTRNTLIKIHGRVSSARPFIKNLTAEGFRSRGSFKTTRSSKLPIRNSFFNGSNGPNKYLTAPKPGTTIGRDLRRKINNSTPTFTIQTIRNATNYYHQGTKLHRKERLQTPQLRHGGGGNRGGYGNMGQHHSHIHQDVPEIHHSIHRPVHHEEIHHRPIHHQHVERPVYHEDVHHHPIHHQHVQHQIVHHEDIHPPIHQQHISHHEIHEDVVHPPIHEQHISRPVMHEQIREPPQIHEHVHRPVYHEHERRRPIVQTHHSSPIIHQEIVEPIIETEVHRPIITETIVQPIIQQEVVHPIITGSH